MPKLKLMVVGNSSADLDSVVSAVTYSWLYNHVHGSGVSVPYIDICRSELRLRKDVELVFAENKVDVSQILFKQDLPTIDKEMKLILVDHNKLQNPGLLRFEVSGIIDHHLDEEEYQDVTPRIVQVSGSCASLVLNYWFNIISDKFVISKIASLVLAPILIDTNNLTQKVESTDLEAVNSISQFSSINRVELYEKIHLKKLDITGLTVYELLLKDYKLLQVGTTKIGFSSLLKDFHYILDNNCAQSDSQFQQGIDEFIKDNQLNHLVMMTTYQDKVFSRELAIYPDMDILTNLSEQLKLEHKFEIAKVQVYQQLETKASRKQVFPLIKSLME